MDAPDMREPCLYCGGCTSFTCQNAEEAFDICGVIKTDRKESSAVYQPHHYAKWPVEPITFILKNKLPYGVGNVIKYVMRYKDKNGLEDLLKARRYIDMIIEDEYGVKMD